MKSKLSVLAEIELVEKATDALGQKCTKSLETHGENLLACRTDIKTVLGALKAPTAFLAAN